MIVTITFLSFRSAVGGGGGGVVLTLEFGKGVQLDVFNRTHDYTIPGVFS